MLHKGFSLTENVQSDISVSEFPDYVRLMHRDRDHRLELEYKV